MPLNNQTLSNNITMYSVLQALKDTINYNMNCVKVATVIEFNPEPMTVKCRVNNKRLKQLKQDGNQILENYPDIYAKVHFFGWGDIGATYPIEAGMEGILLFNDRELQTWFMTGEAEKLAYDRCHDLTDALFICGVHSQPKIPLVPFIEECLHIYYKGSDFQIKDESIEENTKDLTINANTSYTLNTITQTEQATTRNITATTNHTGVITATQLNDTTAATGTFTTSDGKIVTVVNGIVRTITSSN
jgi:hypothetical protein